MSEPQPPPKPPVQTPFRPEVVRSPINPGCGKPLAVGCGLLLVLVVVGLSVLMAKRFELLGWTLEVMRPEIERRLPEGFPAAEKARLESAFSGAVARAKSGKVDLLELNRVQTSFVELSKSERLSAEQVNAFTAVLEGFADGPNAIEAPTDPRP